MNQHPSTLGLDRAVAREDLARRTVLGEDSPLRNRSLKWLAGRLPVGESNLVYWRAILWFALSKIGTSNRKITFTVGATDLR